MLYFIPTPIGNLEDITIRSLRLLLSTPLIICEDTRVAKKLIKLLKERFGSFEDIEQKFIPFHSHNAQETAKNLNIEDFLTSNAAYISDAGMPCISDPGSLLVKFAQENGIAYEVLPGANALLLALAASGFEETNFYFHGFLPHKKEARAEELRKILSLEFNAVLYESTHRILQLLSEIAEFSPQRVIYIIKEATKMYETHYKGSALELAQKLKTANLNGEWAVVIKGGKQREGEYLREDDILPLPLPPKQKAKLLAKMTGKSVKEWYDILLQKSNYL
ncbi:MAG: 16S rRNA (cytidine(1402)-2'-O)-methyltransferase [Campylobacteraceae bacterium]|jgi:16S rRNA (cytidine1402-2'-O)-methyltransferase|nr:16S rRNA (cytidine(1402)-2'-O)-methyltransferase [Campylobacteraceae bacterium]